MKILRIITVAGPVPRVGSHKTHLDNQKLLMQHGGCFENNVYINLPSFQLLALPTSPYCEITFSWGKKNIISQESVRLNFFLPSEYVYHKTRGNGLLVVYVWWYLAPCCEKGFRLQV
jgi:hypothetical protein